MSATTSSKPQSNRARALACGVLALCVSACGDLDNFTTVKDLRVLAVRSEPAGFLVPLDDPASLTNTTATLTALVVDPLHPADVLTLSGEACPDLIDTITSASGKGSKLCPARGVTDQLPPPLNTVLATATLPPGTAGPVSGSQIEYDPQVMFGLTPTQVGLFFSPQVTGNATIDQAVAFNRDFSFDALVNLTFTIADGNAEAIKRVVYWPLLSPDVLPSGPGCPPTQVPNTNPDLVRVDFFRHRVDGIPTDDYGSAPPTISLATDELFVQPVFDAATAEAYFLRVRNADTGLVETQCRKELLTFQFFATSGTFSPGDRTSELSPLLTPPDNGHIPIDSQYKPPKLAELPADGLVTIWVVTRDERAGVSWSSRTFTLTP